MRSKYRKFDQYIRSWYCGLDFGYRPILTVKGYRLVSSQTTTKLSDRMKERREVRENSKLMRDIHHRIAKKKQRVLRESKKS